MKISKIEVKIKELKEQIDYLENKLKIDGHLDNIYARALLSARVHLMMIEKKDKSIIKYQAILKFKDGRREFSKKYKSKQHVIRLIKSLIKNDELIDADEWIKWLDKDK